MIEVRISDSKLQGAASAGVDTFLEAVISAIKDAIGGQLTGENITQLTSDQITLLAWDILHDEVMDGGFVQLIHNGYGAFIYKNPTAKAFREWGLRDLYKLIDKSRRYYNMYHDEIEQDCTDEEFMAMFERFAKFDDFDDDFVENEEEWSNQIAVYVDDHLSDFVTVEN